MFLARDYHNTMFNIPAIKQLEFLWYLQFTPANSNPR